jgi:Zn-dependent protease
MGANMFRHAIPVGRIFGITVDLDYSWFLILALLTWILAVNYFPTEYQAGSTGLYWLMGFVTAVLLFLSVLIHELGHSIVAQNYGLRVPRITLFLFGGVSQMAAEPPSAGAEFWIAVVGPLVSIALAALFWELEPLFSGYPAGYEVVHYLAILNFILAIFNLIPGFPLDGGRVLRSLLWKATGAYQKATSIAATTGRFIGFVLIFLGVWDVVQGALIDGVWIAFIGWYLESAASSQLQMEGARQLIGSHRVADAMQRDFPRVPGGVTLAELVRQFVLTGRNRYFVVYGMEGAGLLTLRRIERVPRQEWDTMRAEQAMIAPARLDTTTPSTGLWEALEKMGRDGVNQLPVVQAGEVVGILSREDILHYLRMLQVFATGRTGPGGGANFPTSPAPTEQGHSQLP